jgi:Cu/Zn superoxide dismutase
MHLLVHVHKNGRCRTERTAYTRHSRSMEPHFLEGGEER